ncbi:MAG: molybdopterin-dependent oxidoreductase [Deltaproteobacteria bacterium]|nr:molybdopterin-dependent oxidoreductase [Deltaproteobacteria bacterium]
MEREIPTFCTRDCPSGCSILLTVRDGRIISHRADPRNPITRHFLCVKGNRYLKRYDSPDRILTPLLRRGGQFVPISWDEALDRAAAKLTETRAESGPLSTLWAQYSGSLSLLNLFMPRIFWIHFGGSTMTRGGISIDALQAAQETDFGACLLHEPKDLHNSRSIVVWGRNPAVTHVHLIPFIREAQKKGARLTVVDPRYSETAQLADHHIAPRPGGDGYLALAVAKEIQRRRDAVPEDVISRSKGWDGYLEMLDRYQERDLLQRADVTREAVRHLASCYWDHRPCATFLGLGINWWRQGGAHARLIHALIFMSGNIGIPGGGANFFNMEFPFDTSVFKEEMANAAARGETPVRPRRLLLPLLGREIEEAQDPPIRTAWISMFNPVASAPDGNRLKKALNNLDYVIVTEQFMTDTAQCADLVLPATTYLEEDDVMYSHGSSYMGPVTAAVPPKGEARSNMEIFQALAHKLGFGAALQGGPWEWIARTWAPLNATGISMEAVKQGPVKRAQPLIPYENGAFRTSDGRFQFITEYEGRQEEAGDFFLVMVKRRSILNTQLLEPEAEPYPIVSLNINVMKQMGLKDGDRVWVSSPLDRVEAVLKGSDSVRPDVAELGPSVWKDDQGGIGRLRLALLSDLGPTAAVNETKVTIQKAG